MALEVQRLMFKIEITIDWQTVCSLIAPQNQSMAVDWQNEPNKVTSDLLSVPLLHPPPLLTFKDITASCLPDETNKILQKYKGYNPDWSKYTLIPLNQGAQWRIHPAGTLFLPRSGFSCKPV